MLVQVVGWRDRARAKIALWSEKPAVSLNMAVEKTKIGAFAVTLSRLMNPEKGTALEVTSAPAENVTAASPFAAPELRSAPERLAKAM